VTIPYEAIKMLFSYLLRYNAYKVLIFILNENGKIACISH